MRGKDYAYYSPYHFAGNKPIIAVDLDGLEDVYFTELDKKQHMTIVYNYEDVKKVVKGNTVTPRIHYKGKTTSQFEGPNKANEKKVFDVHAKSLSKSIIKSDAENNAKKLKDPSFPNFTNKGEEKDILVPQPKIEAKVEKKENEEKKPETIKYVVVDIEVDKGLQKEFVEAPDLKKYLDDVKKYYKNQGFDEVTIRKMVPVDKVPNTGAHYDPVADPSNVRVESRPVVVETGEKPKK